MFGYSISGIREFGCSNRLEKYIHLIVIYLIYKRSIWISKTTQQNWWNNFENSNTTVENVTNSDNWTNPNQ